VDWLRRTERPQTPVAPVPGEAVTEAVEGAAPGVAALLDGVSEDRTHAVLDLGPAAESSLRVYSRYARWVRFVDLLGGGWPQTQEAGTVLLSAVPPQPERPYDLVFAWDILDRLSAEERARLVERLAELTAPGARLHVVVRASDQAPGRPLRFSVLDVDRIRFEPTSAASLPRTGLLPAEVITLLAPFHVVRAFTLKTGLREYVAVRPGS
jgi:hypothetical protein